jgi:hypothetical protein
MISAPGITAGGTGAPTGESSRSVCSSGRIFNPLDWPGFHHIPGSLAAQMDLLVSINAIDVRIMPQILLECNEAKKLTSLSRQRCQAKQKNLVVSAPLGIGIKSTSESPVIDGSQRDTVVSVCRPDNIGGIVPGPTACHPAITGGWTRGIVPVDPGVIVTSSYQSAANNQPQGQNRAAGTTRVCTKTTTSCCQTCYN